MAYQYAGRLLGQPVLSEDGTLLVRACDAPYFGDRTGDIGIFAYKTMGEGLAQPGGGVPDTRTEISVDMTGRIWYLYLGQTAGIALARLLGLNFFAMLLMGRLGNLVLYLALSALGVRLAAKNQRWLFAAAALLPMSLQLAGQSIFTALGKAKNAIFFSLLRKAFINAPLTLLLPLWFGTNGVFIAEAASQFLGGLACFTTMYFVVYRPLGRLEAAGSKAPL